MNTCVCEIVLHRYIYLCLYICHLNESIKCIPLPHHPHTCLVTQAVERVTFNGLEQHRAVDLDVTALFSCPVVDPPRPLRDPLEPDPRPPLFSVGRAMQGDGHSLAP